MINNNIVEHFNKLISSDVKISKEQATKYIIQALDSRGLDIEITKKFEDIIVKEAVDLFKSEKESITSSNYRSDASGITLK